MENEWTEIILGDYAEILSSKRIFAADYVDKGIPFYRSKEIIEKALGQFNDDELYITEKRFYDIKEKFGAPKKGDLLISAVGNRSGIPYCVKDDYDFYFKDGNLIWFRNFKNDLNSLYLEYFLKSNIGQHKIDSLMIGSAQKALTIIGMKSLSFKLPPLSEQKRIAHILGSLDDKIELNRQMNQTLEQMAQALFKSWFVDFDPVIDNALAAGMSIPEELQPKAEQRKALGKDRKPLPEEIQKLFPNKLEYSKELEKWVPKGWKVRSVEDCIDVNPRVKLVKGSIAKFADMKALPTTGYSINEVITKELTSGGSKFQQGDVLLARITPCLQNGKTGIVDFLENDEAGFGSTEFIVLRGKEAITTSFVACLARDDNFRKHCMQSMVGSSGRQRVQNACFLNYFVAIPENEKILNLFDEQTRDNFQYITKNDNQIQTLTTLRDTLLPKLISGELRVPNLIMGDA